MSQLKFYRSRTMWLIDPLDDDDLHRQHVEIMSPLVWDVGHVDNFEEGEEIHTEVSCKFTRDVIAREFTASGMALRGWEPDSRGYFALALGTPTG